MVFLDEAILKMRAEQEGRNSGPNIDLYEMQIIYGEEVGFERRLFFEDSMEFAVPRNFLLMPDEQASQKFLSEKNRMWF